MDFPKDEKTRLRDWLIKLGEDIPKYKKEIKKLKIRLEDLKIELRTSEMKRDIINDMDDESMELVGNLYAKEISDEEYEMVSEVKSIEKEIKLLKDKIKANTILIEQSNV